MTGKKPIVMMKCEHCGDEIVRKMCTQRYCYKCNGEVNRMRRSSLPRKKKQKAVKLDARERWLAGL